LMNLTLPAGDKSPPSASDMKYHLNRIRQKVAGVTELETAALWV
jgi:hypothetical protein